MIITVLCLMPSALRATAVDPNGFDQLVDAIAQVESNNDPLAVGDDGSAIGAYQIHRAYWQDGTRLLGVNWRYEEAFDPQKARYVVKAYLRHYGQGKSLMDLARIHNGGPKGHRKKATLSYACKILALLR